MLTYLAVLGSPTTTADGLDWYVRGDWRSAAAISAGLLAAAGKPYRHEPTEPPTPRYLDVLLHGIRHLRFLLDTDASVREGLDTRWREYLADFGPMLAGMYR